MIEDVIAETVAYALGRNLTEVLFPQNRKPIPNLTDIYELELAFYENLILTDEQLIRNGAYFSRIDGQYTRHFLMCAGEPLKLPDHSSSRLKSFSPRISSALVTPRMAFFPTVASFIRR